MLKKLLFAIATVLASMSIAFAQVDVNKADQVALDGVKGIGPKMSTNILEERKRGGDFKDWFDLESRVKGIGEKSAIRLSGSGLTVNGQARPASPMKVKVEKKPGAASKTVAQKQEHAK